MTLSIRRTKHLDHCDLDRLDFRNKAIMTMLDNKLIMRAPDSKESEPVIEKAFTWLKETCQHFYSIRGPETDKFTIKYIIYFMSEEEMTMFAITFNQDTNSPDTK